MGTIQFSKVILLLIGLHYESTACAKTWIVDKNSSLNSITSVVNSASHYDTIFIKNGRFTEGNIIIRKPLYIKGSDSSVLDGEKKFEIFSIMSSDVTVEGVNFQNGGRSSVNDLAGIKAYLSKNVVIRNCVFREMFFGIYFQECSDSRAEFNKVTSNGNSEIQSGNGIHCWKSTNMKIRNNIVSGQRDGIYFEFVTNSIIENNISEKNIRYGLHFMFSHFNSYTNNIFRHNGAGVAVMYTHDITMIGNTFTDNWGSAAYGLLLKDISNSRIEKNNFTGNTTGIYMEGSSRLKINHNTISGNGYAMKIQASCDGNVVEYNNFKGNTFDVTTNGTLVQNDFDNNYWDKYNGYDLDRDGIGDIPHHPVNMFSMIIEQIPVAMIFFRSFMVDLMDKTEKAIPSLTPENFRDNKPSMKQIKL